MMRADGCAEFQCQVHLSDDRGLSPLGALGAFALIGRGFAMTTGLAADRRNRPLPPSRCYRGWCNWDVHKSVQKRKRSDFPWAKKV